MTVDNHLTPTHLNMADQVDLDTFPGQTRDRAALLLNELRRGEEKFNALHPDYPMHGEWPRAIFMVGSLGFVGAAVVVSFFAQQIDGPVRVFVGIAGVGAVVAAIGCAALAVMGEQVMRIAALKKMRKFYKQIAPRHDEILWELDRLAATKWKP